MGEEGNGKREKEEEEEEEKRIQAKIKLRYGSNLGYELYYHMDFVWDSREVYEFQI